MVSLRSIFFKIDRIHHFDIRYSLFDIRFFRVSFSIRPAFFWPAAGLSPDTLVPMSNFHAISQQLGYHSHFSKLNDDICTQSSSWISEMTRYAPFGAFWIQAIIPPYLGGFISCFNTSTSSGPIWFRCMSRWGNAMALIIFLDNRIIRVFPIVKADTSNLKPYFTICCQIKPQKVLSFPKTSPKTTDFEIKPQIRGTLKSPTHPSR